MRAKPVVALVLAMEAASRVSFSVAPPQVTVTLIAKKTLLPNVAQATVPMFAFV